jgi:hypothetical protein
MIVAENIATAYYSRPKENWGEWARKNPKLEEILNEAILLCQQLTP